MREFENFTETNWNIQIRPIGCRLIPTTKHIDRFKQENDPSVRQILVSDNFVNEPDADLNSQVAHCKQNVTRIKKTLQTRKAIGRKQTAWRPRAFDWNQIAANEAPRKETQSIHLVGQRDEMAELFPLIAKRPPNEQLRATKCARNNANRKAGCL